MFVLLIENNGLVWELVVLINLSQVRFQMVVMEKTWFDGGGECKCSTT
jgi:hypothetical protein